MNELLETTALAGVEPEGAEPAGANQTFWEALIDEAAAAAFMGLTVRCLQGWRYRGGGPEYVRVSARCIRYRRRDLRAFADAKVRTSTSDPGPEHAT